MKRYVILFLMLITGIFIGNRIFNHVNAWSGLAVITITAFLVIRKLIKLLRNEKKD